MQTPGERHLIHRLGDHLLKARAGADPVLILNIGAGRSSVIEQALVAAGCRFLGDRIDVDDCTVESPVVRNCLRCSVERMEPLASECYAVAFANYVLEHVGDLPKAASEIFRVLKPGGLFVATVPNLTAPEFFIARYAPAGLQKIMTGGKGFHTCYAWTTIRDLTGKFEAAGLTVEEIRYWAFTESYLGRYALAGPLSRLYDKVVSGIGLKRLMGNVCITLRKP
jgi:SAM-dependent methyltransferase